MSAAVALENSIEFVRRMDAADELAGFRERFAFPAGPDGKPQTYLCGHSLGLQPRGAREAVAEVLDDWRRLAVGAHVKGRHPWVPYHEFLTESLAELTGSLPVEVVAMNSLTVNLHLMMVSFYRPTASRYRILIERGSFPSDHYAVLSQLRFHGLDPQDALVELGPREGEHALRMEDVERTVTDLGDTLALALLPGVQYYTGQYLDPAELSPLVQSVGAVAGFDLAHAVGNIPLHLHDAGADFAVWCSYKYLNGGPGAIGGCFVHERHAGKSELPRFAGWWGHDKQSRFLMGPEFDPIPGAEGWQLSNPPILAAAPLRVSLDLFHEAGPARLREKSVVLTGFLEFLLRERLGRRVEIITPAEPERRGCQLSLRLLDARRDTGRDVHRRLEEAGIVTDWREPDVIRVAPVPLYNRFEDVWHFVQTLRHLID